MKKSSNGINRTDRLNAEFQKEIHEVITYKLKTPLSKVMVSVLKVDVSKDLKHAKVFLSIYSTDAEKVQETFNSIVSESKNIRYQLSQSMRIRTVPDLQFILDDSMEYSDKISKLLLSIEKQENDKN
jgi:ribosome-binding factor A